MLKNISYGKIAFLDQAVVSLGNFLSTVILLDKLGAVLFGLFTILQFQFLFLNGLQMGWVVSPLNNLWEKCSVDEQGEMEANFAFQQFILTLFIPFGLFFIPNGINSYSKDSLLFFLFIFSALWQEFFRRLCFARKFYWLALISDVMRYLIPMIVIFVLESSNLTEVFAVFILSTCLSIVIVINKFKIFGWFSLWNFKKSFRHWNMAKWLVGSSVLQWFASNYIMILVAQILGPVAIGTFKVCQTIFGCSHIFIKSIESIFPFSASGALYKNGVKALDSVIKKIIIVYGLPMLFFCVMISLFAKPIMELFNLKVNESSMFFMQGFCMLAFISFFIIPLHIGLKALEVTRPIFIILIAIGVLNFLSADYFVNGYGLKGAIVGLILIRVIEISYLAYCYMTKKSKYKLGDAS